MARNNRLVMSLSSIRGMRLVAINSSLAFATLSGVIQLLLAVAPTRLLQGWGPLLAIFVISLSWGFIGSLPKKHISREFKRPDFRVTVKAGDLFLENSHLVIGFTDTFDTDICDRDVISPSSIQGQFLTRIYEGDAALLDQDLNATLLDTAEFIAIPRASKPKGKLRRYPIGTVVPIRGLERNHYCVAYSQMGGDLVAQSSVNYLWQSLSALWQAIEVSGRRGPVAMPVIGSDLARVDNLDYENLVKMILLSFVAQARQSLVTKELSLVLHPRDLSRLNMNEVSAFLNSL